METLTAYEIWKAIHYTNPKDLDEKHGFNAMTKFVKLEILANELRQI